MSNNTHSTSSGIGFTGALFITFLVLKLTGVIDWSWWWVAAPLWIPVLFWVCFISFVLIIVGIAKLFGSTVSHTRPRKGKIPRGRARR